MISINPRVTSLSVLILPFLIILSSIVITDSICHTFLHSLIDPFTSKHLGIQIPSALLTTLLIVYLFHRRLQSSIRKKNNVQLRNEDDWENTFNTMTDFVSVHDKDFRIIKVNQALCDFLEKPPSEIVGKYCYQIFHNSTEAFIGCPHKKTAETGHSLTEIIHAPDRDSPLQITCAPLFDDEQMFQGSLHIARTLEPVNRQSKTVREIIPICAGCKNIRKHDDTWVTPEEYFLRKFNSQFTHTICMDCQEKLYPELIKV